MAERLAEKLVEKLAVQGWGKPTVALPRGVANYAALSSATASFTTPSGADAAAQLA